MKFFHNKLMAIIIVFLSIIFYSQAIDAQYYSKHAGVNEEINHWECSDLKGKVKSIRTVKYTLKLNKEELIKDTIRGIDESIFNDQGYLVMKSAKPVNADTIFLDRYFYNKKGELIEIYTRSGPEKVWKTYYQNWLKVKQLSIGENDILNQSTYLEYDNADRMVSRISYTHQDEDSTIITKRLFFYKDSLLNKILDYKKHHKYKEIMPSRTIKEDIQYLTDQKELVLSMSTSFEGKLIKESIKYRYGKLQENTHYMYDEEGKLIKMYIVHFDNSKDKNENSREGLYKVINYEYNEQGLLIEEVQKHRREAKTTYEYNDDGLLTKEIVWKDELMYLENNYTYDRKGNLNSNLRYIYKDGILDKALLNEKTIEYFD